jgi:hypothetical protein
VALAAVALQQQMIPYLIGVGRKPPISNLAELITSPKSAYSIRNDASTKTIDLDFHEPTYIVSALAADSARLSCAAFQTVAHVTTTMDNRDAAAWSLIKLYYAAFYSAHATLRLLGEACTFLYPEQINRLNQLMVAQATSARTILEKGLYHCRLSVDSKVVSCKPVGSRSGGTHEAFWKVFGNKITEVSSNVLSSRLTSVEAQLVFSRLSQLLDVLKRKAGNNYSWLSQMRNDLQYRLQFGVWYPQKLQQQSRSGLVRLAEQWKSDPLSIEITQHNLGPLGDFVAASVFLIGLCRDLLTHIGDRSSEGKNSFVRAGPLAFINDIATKC